MLLACQAIMHQHHPQQQQLPVAGLKSPETASYTAAPAAVRTIRDEHQQGGDGLAGKLLSADV